MWTVSGASWWEVRVDDGAHIVDARMRHTAAHHIQ